MTTKGASHERAESEAGSQRQDQSSSTKPDTPVSGSAVKSHDKPKIGKILSARHNIVPPVVPGLSVNSGSSSSSAALSQD